MLGAEELFHTADGQAFNYVSVLAAAVVAPAGIALGVFIADHAGARFKDGFAGVVLRCDQDDALALALVFQLQGTGYIGVFVE
jgi:hypothetical protein